MKKILLCLTSLAIPASNAAVTVIDDFFDGTTDATVTGVGSVVDVTSGPTSSIIGGTRVARAHNVSGSGDNSVDNTVVPGRFDWSVDTNTTGHFHLYYGFSTYTGTGEATAWNDQTGSYSDLEADFSGEVGITVRIQAADVSDAIRIGLITNRGEANEAVVSLEVPNAGGPETLTFNFASFGIVEGLLSDLDLTNVDQIIVEAANDLTSADWSLQQIGTIPEPSSALLGLIGLLGLARRRR